MAQKKEKLWQLYSPNEKEQEEIRLLCRQCGLSYVTCTLLYARGFRTAPEVWAFLHKEDTNFYNPYLMKDMDRAVARIQKALQNGEHITVYGDYDVDGVTAVSVLVLYLREIGAKVDYYIPNRHGEGYGLNTVALDRLRQRNAELLITVDTGVTAIEEVEYARTLGMDVVVTDHHECHERLPDACAVVNCRRPDCVYPFKELAGVGVVFKLICALAMGSPDGNLHKTAAVCRKYLDLVAIGTVADVMPLVSENRLIVSIGLGLMEEHPRQGLRALMDSAASPNRATTRAKRPINSTFIGFTLAPRLNAAGRLASAEEAVELFLTDSFDRADQIAHRLCEINTARQEEENRMTQEAMLDLEAISPDDRVIVLAHDGWHHGVIGIVSSRLTEQFCRPSILISFEDGMGKGSGRSLKGLNLVQALQDSAHLLEKYGGHELAAGLSVKRENLEAFRQRINAYAKSVMGENDFTFTLELDAELHGGDLTLSQHEELHALEPFGSGNPSPLFLLRGAKLCSVCGVGQNRHIKLVVEKDGVQINAMYFGTSPDALPFFTGDICDLAVQLDVNDFRGVRSVQLIVRDMHLNGAYEAVFQAQDTRFSDVLHGQRDSDLPALDREYCITVYSHLRDAIRAGRTRLGLRELTRNIGDESDYMKVRLALQVFCELHLIEMQEEAGGYRFSLPVSEKIGLERSPLYRMLQTRSEA